MAGFALLRTGEGEIRAQADGYVALVAGDLNRDVTVASDRWTHRRLILPHNAGAYFASE